MGTLTDLLLSRAEDDHEELLQRLRPVIRSILQERNLLHAPPAHLGYQATSWSDEGVLEDLVMDVYEFNLKRRPALAAQRQHKTNLDPMIRSNIRHFLTQRQRKFDPLGFAVFQNVVAGLERAVESGVLTVSDGGDDIRNNTLLKYPTWSQHSIPAEARMLRDGLSGQGTWEKFIASLKTISHEASEEVERRITRLHRDEAAIQGFYVRELVAPLKQEARALQHATLVEVVGATAPDAGHGDDEQRIVPITQPQDPEGMALRACLSKLEEADLSDKQRAHLKELLQDLHKNPESTQKERARRLDVAPQTLHDRSVILRHILQEVRP